MNIGLRFDPCASLNNLNLQNDDDLKRILCRDKHARIEGLCSEAVFEEDLLGESFSTFSSGWWFKLNQSTYKVAKIAHSLESVTGLDLNLLETFAARMDTLLVVFDSTNKNFRYMQFKTAGDLKKAQSNWMKESTEYKVSNQRPALPGASERNAIRLQKACEYLSSRGALYDAAISRLYANCWLGNTTAWDVDYFVEHQGGLVAFEMKQKYPTNKGTFGLNVGEARLLAFLHGIGIKPVSVVLTKPEWTHTVSGVEQHTLPRYRSNALWLASDFSPAILNQDPATAPSKTQLFGQNSIKYLDIPVARFHLVKSLGATKPGALKNFLDGKTSPLKSISEIPKLQPS